MNLKSGKVYSGYYKNTYFAFEMKTPAYNYSFTLDCTYSGDHSIIKEGEQRCYEYAAFFRQGEWEEVATDYTAAMIDLTLMLNQKDWFYEEVGGRK
ncbi:hypothetical protein AB1K32_15210 [Metabacillus dongyingensis]|uniref:hypothetical protein n=1 Tax=Metabacillus dongyingensis TaxID=2874282 RepID=UPI003B8AD9CA